MKEIQLTQGYTTIVDDEDYERLQVWKWHALAQKSGHVYAQRSVYTPGPRKAIVIPLASQVLEIPVGSPLIVDHIDGNTLDNRKSNLRAVTQAQNNVNRLMSKNNKSGVAGVRWAAEKQRWRAGIGIDGGWTELGCYEIFAEAVEARKDAEKNHLGELRRERART